MSLEVHRRAETLMAAADTAAAQGRHEDAQGLYREAANAEAEAYGLIPADRVRTRGVVAVSAVALFRKSGDPAEALRRAYLYLAEPDLHEAAREDLEDLLGDLRAEQLERVNGRALGPDWFEWRLAGPNVGKGTAPLPLVAQKIDQIQKYATRVYEFVAGMPIRMHGPVDESVREGMELVMSQPAAGSFKFSLRLSVPQEQMALFVESAAVVPERVGDVFFRVLEATVDGDTSQLEQTVPTPAYQDAFMRLVRNLLPDGKDLNEIEVRRQGTDSPVAAVLRPVLRGPLDRRIKARRPPRDTTQRESTRVDVLRGLQLNKHWIVLGTGDRERTCWDDGEVVLEDAVEGLVNHRVRVTGHMKGKRFVIEDIVAADPDEPDQ